MRSSKIVLKLFTSSLLLCIIHGSLLFAEMQVQHKSVNLKATESSFTKTLNFEVFKGKRDKRFKDLRDQDVKKRRKKIQNKSVPNRMGAIRKGQAVFVGSDLVTANTATIQDILRGVKLVPHRNMNGSISGFAITKLRKGCFTSSLGFEVGDVIHRVNTFDILSMSSIYKAYRRLLKQAPEKVTVVYSTPKNTFRKQVITFFKVDGKDQ